MLVWCLRLWTFTGKYSAVQANVKTGPLLQGSFKGVKLEVSVCDESYAYSSMCLAFTLWIWPQEFTPKMLRNSSPMFRHSSLHFVDPAKGVHMHPHVEKY